MILFTLVHDWWLYLSLKLWFGPFCCHHTCIIALEAQHPKVNLYQYAQGQCFRYSNSSGNFVIFVGMLMASSNKVSCSGKSVAFCEPILYIVRKRGRIQYVLISDWCSLEAQKMGTKLLNDTGFENFCWKVTPVFVCNVLLQSRKPWRQWWQSDGDKTVFHDKHKPFHVLVEDWSLLVGPRHILGQCNDRCWRPGS